MPPGCNGALWRGGECIMINQEEREEEEFAGRVRDYALQAKTLRDILNDAILQFIF